MDFNVSSRTLARNIAEKEVIDVLLVIIKLHDIFLVLLDVISVCILIEYDGKLFPSVECFCEALSIALELGEEELSFVFPFYFLSDVFDLYELQLECLLRGGDFGCDGFLLFGGHFVLRYSLVACPWLYVRVLRRLLVDCLWLFVRGGLKCLWHTKERYSVPRHINYKRRPRKQVKLLFGIVVWAASR